MLMWARKYNQKIHQWSAGSVRHKLSYKSERLGMGVELQYEHSTSKTCPVCEYKRRHHHRAESSPVLKKCASGNTIEMELELLHQAKVSGPWAL